MLDRDAANALAGRIHKIRVEVFGPDGLPALALASGIPVHTWKNYESGVSIPGLTLLLFIKLTSVQPGWLLHGEGPKYLGEIPADG